MNTKIKEYINKVENTVYIAMLSGGRDSTAMTIKILEQGMKLDYILFTDTQNEFPEMYDYLEKVDQFLQNNFNKKITYLKTDHSFEDWAKGEIKSGKRQGMIRGLPMITVPCYWKRQSKVRPFEKFLKDKKITDYVQYIGYVYSEKKRANVVDVKQRFPLINFQMCELEVDQLLKKHDLVNPLYKKFSRTGCYFCPYQSDRSFYLVKKFHPEEFERMKKLESYLLELDNCINPQWHIRYSLEEIEELIDNGTWIFKDEAPEACGCQI